MYRPVPLAAIADNPTLGLPTAPAPAPTAPAPTANLSSGFYYHQDAEIPGLPAKNAPLLPYQPVVTSVLYSQPDVDSGKEVLLFRPLLNWDAMEGPFSAARALRTVHGTAHIQRSGLQVTPTVDANPAADHAWPHLLASSPTHLAHTSSTSPPSLLSEACPRLPPPPCMSPSRHEPSTLPLPSRVLLTSAREQARGLPLPPHECAGALACRTHRPSHQARRGTSRGRVGGARRILADVWARGKVDTASGA